MASLRAKNVYRDKFLDKNPVYRIGPPTYTNVANLAVKILTERLTGQDGHDAMSDTDFLDLYIEAQGNYPDVVDNTTIISCEFLSRENDATRTHAWAEY